MSTVDPLHMIFKFGVILYVGGMPEGAYAVICRI